MKFEVGKGSVELKGLKPQPLTLEGSCKAIVAFIAKRQGLFLQVELVSTNIRRVVTNVEIGKLLEAYKGVFEEPKGLPP